MLVRGFGCLLVSCVVRYNLKFLKLCDSAWVKSGNENQRKVGMTLRWKHGRNIFGGEVMAKKACWSLLKGGITADLSGPIHIFFKVKNTYLLRFPSIMQGFM